MIPYVTASATDARAEVESNYTVVNGVIRSPGKFEGEPVYAPYFYSLLMDGGADDDDGNTAAFFVNDDDIAAFPELAGMALVLLIETDNGFVSCGAHKVDPRELA